MSKIKYYSNVDYTVKSELMLDEELNMFGDDVEIIPGSIEELKSLLLEVGLQLDIETNFVENITDREVTVIQLGTTNNKFQYIFDIPRLPDGVLEILLQILRSNIIFYIHNAKFEYTVLKQVYGIDIRNIRDTYIMVKLLNNGLTLPKGYLSLAGLVEREYGISLDKGAQTSFDGSELTYAQIIYAALDVVFIEALHTVYMEDIVQWKLKNLYMLECSAVRSLGDMEVNGALFDKEYHLTHIESFVKESESSYADIINIIKNDSKVVKFLEELNFIQPNDEYLFKWTSPKIKKKVLKLVFPQIETSNKQILKKFLGDSEDMPFRFRVFLQNFLDGEYENVEKYLITNHNDELLDMDMFVKKGTFKLNLDSPTQRLQLFKYWYPNLLDTKEKTLRRKKEPIIKAYKKYIKASKLVTSFGERMFDYVEKDDAIHTNFNQLVSTGRVSSSKPNLQQMPSSSQFRNAFIARPGFSFVGIDYSSQELFVAAQASGDPGYWKAIKDGLDLHSYSASLIFGDDWIKAGGEAIPIGKPKTPEAKAMRTAAKSLSFSLLYGSSAVSLSENLEITHKEALELMSRYFEIFPKLGQYMKDQNSFGIRNKYARALPPFNRVRFFDDPKDGGEKSSIGRKSQNFGIQGSSATMTKLALVYIKNFIELKGLSDKVKITLAIHDEILCEVHDSIADKWLSIQTKLMEKAANVIIPGGWLGVEGEIMKKWNK